MKRNKWASRRFLAALWAIVLTSWIVFKNMVEFLQLALILVSIVGIWVGGESYLKKVYHNNPDNSEIPNNHREDQ